MNSVFSAGFWPPRAGPPPAAMTTPPAAGSILYFSFRYSLSSTALHDRQGGDLVAEVRDVGSRFRPSDSILSVRCR